VDALQIPLRKVARGVAHPPGLGGLELAGLLQELTACIRNKQTMNLNQNECYKVTFNYLKLSTLQLLHIDEQESNSCQDSLIKQCNN